MWKRRPRCGSKTRKNWRTTPSRVDDGDFECILGADAPDSFNLMVLVNESAHNTQFAVEVLPAPGVEDVDKNNNTDATTVLPARPQPVG